MKEHARNGCAVSMYSGVHWLMIREMEKAHAVVADSKLSEPDKGALGPAWSSTEIAAAMYVADVRKRCVPNIQLFSAKLVVFEHKAPVTMLKCDGKDNRRQLMLFSSTNFSPAETPRLRV
jgi:hypothetical protein